MSPDAPAASPRVAAAGWDATPCNRSFWKTLVLYVASGGRRGRAAAGGRLARSSEFCYFVSPARVSGAAPVCYSFV